MSYVPEDTLVHYGMPRRSGRYPWGSGEDPYQRQGGDLLSRVQELRKQGKKDTDIAAELGIFGRDGKPSTGKLRTQLAWANDERALYEIAQIKSMRSDGLGWTEIGRKLGKSESTIRSMLKPEHEDKAKKAFETAEFIRRQVKKNRMVDVGSDVANELGISKEKLDEALYILERDGYPIYKNRAEQQTNAGNWTTQRIICAPGTPYKDTWQFDKIHPLNEEKYVSTDNGEHFDKILPPKSLDSSRIAIRYADQVGPDGFTGEMKDGVVELRRGVKDLNLDGSRYSQVRILVDGTHYIKGMAVYSDDLPDGVDIMFNTNKKSNVAKMDVLKPIKSDPDNPFGSLIKSQVYYTDENGERHLTPINKRADQGDWTEWKDTLPSQFLSKQPLPLINRQLGIAKADKQAEFEEICSLTNPTIKKYFLEKFADECDSTAVHLKAAPIPGQKYHVIVPNNTLGDNEIYAPQYKDGTQLALVRYPHGGIFEIPRLTVNNKNELGKKLIGNDSIDAVCINKKIADQLSGADFDGDTVMCIPTHGSTGINISTRPPLDQLKGFDPKAEYPAREGMRYMEYKAKDGSTINNTQKEMGSISNLITDMTLGGATEDELARAVKHSMVVIDAAKHKLDYTRSAVDNNIAGLKKKWQAKLDPETGKIKYGGAATLISRAKSEVSVDKKQGSRQIDPETGKVTYKVTDDLYYPIRKFDKKTGEYVVTTIDNKRVRFNPKDAEAVDRYAPVKRVDPDTGEVSFTNKAGDIRYKTKTRSQASTAMAETDDATTLLSLKPSVKELAYADYANSMKALANTARKTMMATEEIKRDPTAARTYADEVKSLDEKLQKAMLNAPRERAAQRMAGAAVKAKQLEYKSAGQEMSKEDIKKERQRATEAARNRYNAIRRRDRNIDITDMEWEAIQAGAISKTTLRKILNNTDTAKLRQRAMPRNEAKTISPGKVNRIKTMAASGRTLQQIADALGVSPSTVNKYLKGSD